MVNTIASTKFGDSTTGIDDTVIGANTAAAGSFTTLAASGNTTLSGNLTVAGTTTRTIQTLAAAGATQGDAGAITGGVVVVTITASTQGIRLPTAVAGLQVQVFNNLTLNVNVYPATGANIGAGVTNAAVVLSAAKSNIYLATSATQWLVLTGA